ncbi:2-C-methyl-D-erythritol 4-phosphate cytidylyltransferase [Murimonas intestini]|uniref:2-C-methyl-D-erythritol 4-phosphate cytidylyltransferase n=1 Tax=Murimonas intestini TaxID=1337051 RepID=UPI0011DDA0A6|nr:2-C-methyl-D-erythritol 4-phosphate cytidylyltransferase [Murimonas intestini]
MKSTAIVLAAGKGKRMNSSIHKQYLLLAGRPVICYSLETFQKCPFIDEIILVAGEGEEEYCRHEIAEKYGFDKVSRILPGGRERYDSVYAGLKAAAGCDFVYIHDGARPFVDDKMLCRAREAVEKYQACVVGMPVKDTIKVMDQEGFAAATPERKSLFMVQTPQVFAYDVIRRAYDEVMSGENIQVTDDAMMVEKAMNIKVKLVEGSYENIKITTPEDLRIAECFCAK